MRLPVTLVPRPSRILSAAMVAAHGVTAVALVPTGLALAMKLVLWLALGASLYAVLRRPAVGSLTLKADGSVDVVDAYGKGGVCTVLPGTTVMPWLVVLLIRGTGAARAIILLPDALLTDEDRQLRLWLKWKASVAGA